MTERGTVSGSFPRYKVGDSGTFNNRQPLNPSNGAVYQTIEYKPSVVKNNTIKFDVTPDDEYTMPPALNITSSLFDGISGFTSFVSPPINKRPCCTDGNPAPKKIGYDVALEGSGVNLGVVGGYIKKGSPEAVSDYYY